VEHLQAKHASVMRKLHGFGRQRAKPVGSKSKLLLRKSLLERIRACQETSAGGSIEEGSLVHAGNVTKAEYCGPEPTAAPRLTDELKFRKRDSGVTGIMWVVARKANCAYWAVRAHKDKKGMAKYKHFSVQRHMRYGCSFEKAVEKALTDAKTFQAGRTKQGSQKRCLELPSAEPVEDAGAVAAPMSVEQSTNVLVQNAGVASPSEAASVEDLKQSLRGTEESAFSQLSAASRLAEEPSSKKRQSGVKGIIWLQQGKAPCWLVQKNRKKTRFTVKQYMKIGISFDVAVEKALAAAKLFHAGHAEQVKQDGLKLCLERPSAEPVGHAEVASEHASADQNANFAECASMEDLKQKLRAMEEKCRRLEEDNTFLLGLHNHVLMQFQLRTERLAGS